jgi:ADP-ribose pyrophosphatase YjhB (NUDIX family)
MPSIDCLITKDKRLLLARAGASAMLRPIGTAVNSGESPLEACLRAVRELTGLHINPSCAAIVLTENTDHAVDYHLSFIAEEHDEEPAPDRAAGLVWVSIGEVGARDDIPALERALIPRLLTSGAPVAVIIETAADGSRRIKDVSLFDPARLSPLVFAVTP